MHTHPTQTGSKENGGEHEREGERVSMRVFFHIRTKQQPEGFATVSLSEEKALTRSMVSNYVIEGGKTAPYTNKSK